MKICSKCKEEKEYTFFSKNRAMKDGYCNQCKVCERYSTIKSKFGISQEQYQYLLDKQGGKCAICDKTEIEEGRSLAVDHDHKTGEIFGLLCFFCNHRFIGRNRNPERYFRAALYLTKGTGWIVPSKKKKPRKRKAKKINND